MVQGKVTQLLLAIGVLLVSQQLSANHGAVSNQSEYDYASTLR